MASIRPLLELFMLLGVLAVKMIVHHSVIRITDRSIRVPWGPSLLAVGITILVGTHGAGYLVQSIPVTWLPYAVFVVAGPLFLLNLLLTRLFADIGWLKASSVALLWAIAALALDHATPRLAKRILPAGKSLTEHLMMMDAATAAAHRLSELEAARKAAMPVVEKAGPDIVGKALDALASLTAKEERKSVGRDLARGIEMYRERKRLMDQMTPQEIAEYRAEMSAFMAEQGLTSDMYSMEQLENLSSSDLELIMTALSDAEGLFGVTADLDAERRDISDSLSMIADNLLSLELSEEEMALFKKAAESGAVGELIAITEEARARKRPAIDTGFLDENLAELVPSSVDGDGAPQLDPDAMSALVVSAPQAPLPDAEPPPQIHCIPLQLGNLFVSVAEGDPKPWVDAARRCNITGFARIGDAAVVLLADGNILNVADSWGVTVGKDRYDFEVTAVANGTVHFKAQPDKE